MPFNSRPYDPYTGEVGGGVFDTLRRMMGRLPQIAGRAGLTGMPGLMQGGGGQPDPSQPSSPRAISTPPSAPVNPGSMTKTDDDLGPLVSHGTGYTPHVPGSGLLPAERPHIQFARPGEDLHTPGTGISSYVGIDKDQYLDPPKWEGQSNFMGTQGVGGGGGFSPSQQDWSKVANPEAFDAYDQPLRDAARLAEKNRLQRSVTDPMWEERERAKIWTEAQTGSQTGIIESLMANIDSREKEVKTAMQQDPRFLSLPPEEQEKKMREAADTFAAERSSIIERYRFSQSAMPSSTFQR